MELIDNFDQMVANTKPLEDVRILEGHQYETAYRELIKRGRVFLPYLTQDGMAFAPSRFVGYVENSIPKHKSNMTKDGRLTNERINKILSDEFSFKIINEFDTDIEGFFLEFATNIGIEPQNINRSYWKTPEIREWLEKHVTPETLPTHNPNWTEAELALATQFYRRYAPSIPGKPSKELISLSNEIRTAGMMQGLHGNNTFRNPNGVYMKLMELRKYDETYPGVGLGHERKREIEASIFAMSDANLKSAVDNVRARIANFESTGKLEKRINPPNSAVLKSLIASSDPVESQLGRTLHLWQESKRQRGKRASLGREPGQIKNSGAVSVIERRVRSDASGFDEVTSANASYEKIVVDHPERFASDVVESAKARLTEYDLATPTDDREELETKAKEILARPHMINKPPAGCPTPRRQVANSFVYLRDPRVVAYTQRRANGICELCGETAPFKRPDGSPYLETHHVVPLAENGPDTPENCAGVCPNCHRALHSARNKDELAKVLTVKLASF